MFPFLSCKCDPVMPSEFSLPLKGKKTRSRGSQCCRYITFEVHYHLLGYCAVFREQSGCAKLDVFAAIFMTAFGKKTGTLCTEENLVIICCQCSWDKPLLILKLLSIFHRTVYHGCSLLFLSADSDRFSP